LIIDLKTFPFWKSCKEDVELGLVSEPVPINIQFATHLGLVITEIVSNAFKDAFVIRSQGKISITIRFDGEIRLLLTIGDDGIGVDGSFDTRSENTLGLHVIRTMVENQVSWAFFTTTKSGLTCFIVFSDLLLG